MAKLYRRKNGIYYQITYLNGRQVRRSTGKRTQKEATAIVAVAR